MISYDDIQELQQYKSGTEPAVLSLYLNVDQSNASNLNRGFETTTENLFRRIAPAISSGNGEVRFEIERRKVLEFLRSYVPHGKSLALFADSSKGLWWHRDLGVELPTEARWSPKPWLRPLLEVLEETDRFAAVLIDKHRARILTVDASGMREEKELISDVPGKHTTTGTDHIWSQGQMERDHTNHIKSHARRAADELALVIDRQKLSRVVVGGPVEATSIFLAELPKRVEQMVIGSISAALEAADNHLVEELRAVQRRSEHQDESSMVDSMITAAMKGDRAVLGISDTLLAIQQGRVYRMVVARDYRTEGRECLSCHVLTTGKTPTCSFCGGELAAAPDLVNRASHRVIEQAGKVQLVSGDAAAKLAEAGIGAILRF
jgi:peptide chain release factor subunit 1